MAHQIVTIERATPERLREVLEILSQVDLPHDGVEEHFSGFLVARSGGEFVGCVGLERHGKLGLLRSAAVLPRYQGQWIGSKLIRELLKHAADEGVTEVALLTTTAKDYFESKFGFKEARRDRYEKRLRNSPEWNLPRCSTAAFMTLKLKTGTRSVSQGGL
jgi:N-acetylglutamate synthase-like GNAT family acetyltransferase